MSEVAVNVPWPFEPVVGGLGVDVTMPVKGDLHEVVFLGSAVSEQREDTLIRVTSTRYPSLSWWVAFGDIAFEQVTEPKKTELAPEELESAPLDLGPPPPEAAPSGSEAPDMSEPEVTEPEKTEASE